MAKRYAEIGKDCVACGSCIRVCPVHAVTVWRGVTAVVDKVRCVGCGKCAAECPAGAITLQNREELA